MISLESWMSELSDSIKTKKITELSLPGTHDSASYQFDGTCMPNKVGGIHVGFLEFLRKLCPCLAGKIINDWTLTQDLSIENQLKNGIRVFDLRLSFVRNRLLLSHTFSCLPLVDFLIQLKDFMDNHPSEVVIVLLKPDYIHRDTLTEQSWNGFSQLVESYIGDLLNVPQNYIIPTLEQCQSIGKRVFVNVEYNIKPTKVPEFIWTTLRQNLYEAYLHDSPSDEIVINDVIGRLFKSCCYSPKTLRNFSKTPEEFLVNYENVKLYVDVWWLNFPEPEIVCKLIDFNRL